MITFRLLPLDTSLLPPTPQTAASLTPASYPGRRSLLWIAAYNLGKGFLMLTLALGLRGFLHKDVDVIVGRWFTSLGVSLENEHVAALLARLDVVTDNQLHVLSIVTLVFGGVFITEGIGLFFRQRWAEFLTVVVTASFIPVELFESIRHVGPAKVILLLINVTVVCSLIWILRKNAPPAHIPPSL